VLNRKDDEDDNKEGDSKCEEEKKHKAKDGEQGEVGIPLYMGMHCINSAIQAYWEGTEEFENAEKDTNCKILSNGSVEAIKKLGKDCKLLVFYPGLSSNQSLQGSKVVEGLELVGCWLVAKFFVL